MLFASLLLAGLATASPYPDLKRGSWSGMGIATFNSFSVSTAQPSLNCGSNTTRSPNTFGAAASDVSPNISGGTCPGSIGDHSCNGQAPELPYSGPSCPKNNCGTCYKVTNQGSANAGSTIGGIGNSVVVQIIDSCPHTSAWNYCKTDTPANQRCGDYQTNQLDIDQGAYMALTGVAFGSGPNLNIMIEPASC